MSKKVRKNRAKSVMHTDIKDLEVTRKIRELANKQVTDWELSDVLPAVKELANKEVDVAGFFRRTANYRIIEWELPGRSVQSRQTGWDGLSEAASTCIHGISMFLQYVARELVIHRDTVRVEIIRRAPSDFRFQLLMPKEDAAALIGHGGHTAAALRNWMQAAGERHGLAIDLKILSMEERQSEAAPQVQPAPPHRATQVAKHHSSPSRRKKAMQPNVRHKRTHQKDWEDEDN